MQSISTGSGRRYLDESDGAIGSKAPFYAVYETPDGTDRYGWYCSHCEGVDTAMDSMGRIQCNRCGNLRKPTEWDAAHE